MTQQTEAQRLANELDAYHVAPHHKQAAAELRRLDEVEKAYKLLLEKTYAQRLPLADLLETDGWPDAAAELRRLEAEVERKAAGIKFLWQECDNQERINAQLLEALKLAAEIIGHQDDPHSQHIARVIAKATKE